MDPYKVLGVKEGSVRTNGDLDKLRHKTKELYKSYLKAKREDKAKNVEKAFDQIKQKVREGLPQSSSRGQEAGPQKEEAKVAAAGATGYTPSASSQPASANGQERKRGGDDLNPESVKKSREEHRKRRADNIQQKLVEKRKAPPAEDPETARRREVIRQRLVEKRGGSAAPASATGADAVAAVEGDGLAPATQSATSAAPSHLPPPALRILPRPTVLPTPTSLLRPKRPTVGVGARTHRSRRSGRSAVLWCSLCGQSVERESFRFCGKDEEGFVCPQCRIRGMDPFNHVKEDRGGLLKFILLQPPVVEKNVFDVAKFSFKRDFKKLKDWRKAGYNVEIRMVTLEDFKTHHVWPRSFELQINKRPAFEVQPPKAVGEKRRDAPKNVSAHLKPGINDFRVSIRDHNVQRFAFALVRTKPRLIRELCKQVPVKSADECKQKVNDALFSSMLDGQGQDCQFSVSDRIGLDCPVTLVRMKTPARGRKCKHLQCFDLMAFLATNQKIGVFNKRWLCPVCDIELKSFTDMFIDTYVIDIISAAERDVVEVAFDQIGDWSVSARAEPGTPSPRGEDALGAEDLEDLDEPDLPGPTPGPSPGPEDGECSDAGDDAVASPTDAPMSSPPEGSPLAASPPQGSPPVGSPPIGSPSVESDVESADEQPENHAKAAEVEPVAAPTPVPPADYIDPMDEENYVVVELPKPMGIVFEANVPYGGVLVKGFSEDGAAVKHGRLKLLDQLVSVGGTLVKGKSFNSCIDRIVDDPSELTKLTVFRGKPIDLYGKFGASEEWILGLLQKVESGKMKAAPANEERKGPKRLAMPVSDSSSGSEDDNGGFSDHSSSVDTSEVVLPERLTSCISGAGLEEDLQKCVEALPNVSFDGAPKRISSEGLLPRCILKSCTGKNSGAWEELDGKDVWRRAARKKLADAANLRVDRLEALERQKQESVRQAALAELRRSQEDKKRDVCGKATGPLLQVEPSRIRFDANRQAQIMLRNRTDDNVAFKVKTTAPKFILVEPTAGLLPKAGSLAVQIVSTERLNIISSQEVQFLVQAVPVPGAAAGHVVAGHVLSKERWSALHSSIQEFSVLGKI